MKKLTRSRHNKIIAGVCGGLGRYFNIDTTVLRLFFIFLCILTAILPLLLGYFIAWIIIPLEPENDQIIIPHKLYRSKTDKKIAGICGGIAELLEVDATIVRLISVFLCLLTGFFPLFIAYLVGWVIIPEKNH